MKRLSVIGVLLCVFVFGAFAIGSGSDDSTRDSVSISEDGDEEKSSDSSVEDGKKEDGKKEDADGDDKKSDDIKYEITDTSFEHYTNSIGSEEYYGFVEISNTGDNDIYMDSCTFDLEDNDGHLLQSEDFISSCPEVISPGEKGYFYNGLGSSSIDKSVSMDNGVKLVPQMKLTKATGKPHSFPVSDISVKEDGMGYVKVTGRVENDTEEDASLVTVYMIFYDADGKAIAITNTTVTDITAGGKSSFDTSLMFATDSLKFDNIADTVVIAEDMYMQF